MTCITYVAVFGLDGNGRPHAACFAEHDAALAIKAAHALGYRTLQLPDAKLAHELRLGNVFGRGPAFVPRVSRARFERLLVGAEAGVDDTGVRR